MKKYFIYENQQQAGPFTFEELASKNIKAETPVWFEGLADWQRADQIVEIKNLIPSTPPSFSKQEQSPPHTPLQQNHAYQSNIRATKKSGGTLIKTLGIIAAAVILIVVIVAAMGNNDKMNDLLGKDTYQEKVMTVEEIERSNPSRFLEASGNYRPTLLGKNFRIFGELSNSATIVNYRNVTLRIAFYAESGALIEEYDYAVANNFPAHTSKKFELKIERPTGCRSLGMKVINAVPY